MFLTSLYRGMRLALFACTLAFTASAAFAQSAPAAPTNVAATAGNTKISLSWSVVSGAKSYIIYRSTTSGNGYKLIGTPSGRNGVDNHVIAGMPYYYVVTAVNTGGESPQSAPVSAATPAPANAPVAPTNVAATAGNAKVNLSWSSVPGADSYIVYRSTTSGSGYRLIGTPTGPTGVDRHVIAGMPYYYVVTAVNFRGESSQSVQISAATPAPANAPTAPTNVAATAGNAKINLSWSPVSGADSYIIYRSTTSGNGYKLIGTPTGPNVDDRHVIAGTTYYYVVTAVNFRGEGSQSAQVSAVPPAPGTSP